ncbi:unnamed protein product [Gongylonema pulchrum]|uniref:Lipoprotein n=1 Tax=Gongylonema pulchrum TaxID=637853 RepID=A0A183EHN5_9BILA|nr:unnamed protein product [Gongylonema pulchrum]
MDETDNGTVLAHGQVNNGEATSEVERPDGTPVWYRVDSASTTTNRMEKLPVWKDRWYIDGVTTGVDDKQLLK